VVNEKPLNMDLKVYSKLESTFVPLSILENYEKISQKHFHSNWKSKKEEKLWSELCFCILSANVNYELAKSTLKHLSSMGFLNPVWLSKKHALNKLEKELEKPMYLPKKRDGGLRQYRYPKKRSEQLVKASKFLYKKHKGIKSILMNFSNAIDARQFLASNISGIGIKEASHYLRNIGYCDSLAIIDIHILNFLKNLFSININKKSGISNKMYLFLEKILANFAKFHNLTLSILDMAIWHYMRNKII